MITNADFVANFPGGEYNDPAHNGRGDYELING